MKIRNVFILTALIFAVFVLGACGILDGSDGKGVIIINFGNSGGRYAVTEQEKEGMIYTITLTSPGQTPIGTTYEGPIPTSAPIKFSVPEGIWDINVTAERKKYDSEVKYRIGKGEGKKPGVEVVAGKPTPPVDIEMKVTGTQVHSWKDLKEDFDELKKADSKLKYLQEIEIITEEIIYTSEIAIENALTLDIEKERNIILWSEKNATIMRSPKINTNATVFTINKGTLTLESRNGGTITIDGNKTGVASCSRALINVAGGILEMYDGVTLQNNETDFGGGVWVSGANAYFYMYGGTITNNRAKAAGGGVYIKEGGHFIKTGGTVYGSGAGDNSNTAPQGTGNAVYNDTTKAKEEGTLEKTDPWPKP